MLSGRGVVRFLDRAQQDAIGILLSAPVDTTATPNTFTANGTYKVRARFDTSTFVVEWTGDLLTADTSYTVQQISPSAGTAGALREPAVFAEAGKVTVALTGTVAAPTDFYITAFPAV